MFDKNVLERRLNNRMSRNDLVNRGIINGPQVEPNVAYYLSQHQKHQTGQIISEKISTRPSKQDLVLMQILGCQDYDTTDFVKKQLLDHLNNRPGPIDVIHRLVSQDENLNFPQNLNTNQSLNNNMSYDPQNMNNFPQKYQNIQPNMPFHYQNNQKAHRSSRKPLNNGKFKNITFHEFVPNSSGSGGRFVKSESGKNREKAQMSDEHYQHLIEQQALFLQFELSLRNEMALKESNRIRENVQKPINQNLNRGVSPAPKSRLFDFSDILNDGISNVEYDLFDNSFPFSNESVPISTNNSFLGNFMPNNHINNHLHSNSSEIHNFNIFPPSNDCSGQMMNDNNSSNRYNSPNCILKSAEETSDMYSSGYGTCMASTDNPYYDSIIGFGMSNDCGGFTSVYEKVELFEKLEADKNSPLFNRM